MKNTHNDLEMTVRFNFHLLGKSLQKVALINVENKNLKKKHFNILWSDKFLERQLLLYYSYFSLETL